MSTNTLGDFVALAKHALDAFEADWQANHSQAPENWPLALPSDNTGLWFEFFSGFLDNYRPEDPVPVPMMPEGVNNALMNLEMIEAGRDTVSGCALRPQDIPRLAADARRALQALYTKEQ